MGSVIEKNKAVVSFTCWWSGSRALAASSHFHSVRDLTLKSGSASSCCKAFRASSQLFCGSSLLRASGSPTPSATFRSSATRVHQGTSGKLSISLLGLTHAGSSVDYFWDVFFHFDRQLFGLTGAVLLVLLSDGLSRAWMS